MVIKRTNQKGIIPIASILYLIFGFIVGVILVRIIFLLLGANPSSGFVSWIYSVSQPLVAPFAGIFNTPTLLDGQGVATLDVAGLVAVVVYGIVGALLGGLSNRR